MQLALQDLPESKRLDEIADRLGSLPVGEVLTIVTEDDPRAFAADVVARAGDGFDVSVFYAPHKKTPVRLVHLKRKHRPA